MCVGARAIAHAEHLSLCLQTLIQHSEGEFLSKNKLKHKFSSHLSFAVNQDENI